MNGRLGVAPQIAVPSESPLQTLGNCLSPSIKHPHARPERRCRRADVRRDAESLRVPDAHRQPPFILARPDPDPEPPRPARGPAPAPARPRPSGRGPLPCPSRPTGTCHPAEGAAGAGARLSPAVGSAAPESIRASPRPPRRAEAPARPASPPRGRAGPAGPRRG